MICATAADDDDGATAAAADADADAAADDDAVVQWYQRRVPTAVTAALVCHALLQ